MTYAGPTSGRNDAAGSHRWRPRARAGPAASTNIEPKQIHRRPRQNPAGRPVLLIVEDDPHYARVLLGLAPTRASRASSPQRGTRAVPGPRNISPPRSRSTSSCPTCSAGPCSNHLKHDPATRHIPVQIMTVEEERQHGLEHGAFSYMVKPITTEGSEVGLRPDQGLHLAAASNGCSSSRTTRPSARASSNCWRTKMSKSPPPPPARRLEALHDRAFRLRRPGSALARHVRLRSPRERFKPNQPCATCRSSSSPARN